MTHNNPALTAAVLGGMTAAAVAGTYVGARAAGKSHEEAKKNCLKDTLHRAEKVTHAFHTVEFGHNLAASTSSQLDQ